jgi:hypothetical protein
MRRTFAASPLLMGAKHREIPGVQHMTERNRMRNKLLFSFACSGAGDGPAAPCGVGEAVLAPCFLLPQAINAQFPREP